MGMLVLREVCLGSGVSSGPRMIPSGISHLWQMKHLLFQMCSALCTRVR